MLGDPATLGQRPDRQDARLQRRARRVVDGRLPGGLSIPGTPLRSVLARFVAAGRTFETTIRTV
jgi:hypothetical protein